MNGWHYAWLALVAIVGCRGSEPPRPTVSPVAPDAAPDVGSEVASDPVVATVEIRPLTGQWRGWKITASGRVAYHDPFEGDDTLMLTPAEVGALVAGLRACGLCELAKLPTPDLGPIMEWRGVVLTEGKCSVNWPTDAWTKNAAKCEQALRDGLAPLRTSCKGCEY